MLSVDVPIQNPSLNYKEEYQTCGTVVIRKHYGCCKYEIFLYDK